MKPQQIYAVLRPRRGRQIVFQCNHTAIYVGRSCRPNARLLQHKRYRSWAAASLTLHILEGGLVSVDEADARERFWIETLRELGFPLQNQVTVRVGSWEATQEMREKIGRANRAVWARKSKDLRSQVGKRLSLASAAAMAAKTEEERKAIQERTQLAARAGVAAMTEEQKATRSRRISKKVRAAWARRSPEQKAEAVAKRFATVAAQSGEQRKQKGLRVSQSKRAAWAAFSEEERERIRRKARRTLRANIANLTPEQKAEQYAKSAASIKAGWYKARGLA